MTPEKSLKANGADAALLELGEELGARGGVDDDRLLRAVVAAIRYLECHSVGYFIILGHEKQVAGARVSASAATTRGGNR